MNRPSIRSVAVLSAIAGLALGGLYLTRKSDSARAASVPVSTTAPQPEASRMTPGLERAYQAVIVSTQTIGADRIEVRAEGSLIFTVANEREVEVKMTGARVSLGDPKVARDLEAPFTVIMAKDGKVTSLEVKPEDVGIARSSAADLKGGDAAQNAEALRGVLEGRKNAFRDAAVMTNPAPSDRIRSSFSLLLENS